MKRLYHFIFLLCLYSAGATAQNDFCDTMIVKARMALQQRQYNAARDYVESALPLCDTLAAVLAQLQKDINKAIDDEKESNAKTNRFARNLAKAIIAQESNPTLAFQVFRYNTQRHPTDKASAIMFYKMATDTTKQFPFFQKNTEGASRWCQVCGIFARWQIPCDGQPRQNGKIVGYRNGASGKNLHRASEFSKFRGIFARW